MIKTHNMISPATPVPIIKTVGKKPKFYWTDKMVENNTFIEVEKKLILGAKDRIKSKLETFNMTVRKLGPMYEHSYFLAGGAIGSLLRDEEPNDWDIYFFDGVVAATIFNLYEKDPSYRGEVAVWEEKYRDIQNDDMMITENATTLKNGLQLIRKHYGEPGAIRKTFDFVHCLPYYDSRDKKLYISREQYDLNVNKKLKTNNQDQLKAYREDKFLNKGWSWL